MSQKVNNVFIPLRIKKKKNLHIPHEIHNQILVYEKGGYIKHIKLPLIVKVEFTNL